MRPPVFEVAALAAYGGAIAFLYRAVSFLADRDYVAAILCAGVGLAVARLGGDLLRFALWRAWSEERSRSEDAPTEEP
jgi:hypothetical protein